MSDDRDSHAPSTDSSAIAHTADAVKGALEAVPVYQDALQPGARQLGRAGETVGKAINLALAPISALVWGAERIEEWLKDSVGRRLADVPPDQIVTPKLLVAGPTVEALRFAGDEDCLRDLYANLLATAMVAGTADQAHPAFVEIIKQLTPDEARLLSHVARQPPWRLGVVALGSRTLSTGESGSVRGTTTIIPLFSDLTYEASCVNPEMVASYLTNMERLGIIDIDLTRTWASPIALERYTEIEAHPSFRSTRTTIDGHPQLAAHVTRGIVQVTPFGHQFISVVVAERVTHGDQTPSKPG